MPDPIKHPLPEDSIPPDTPRATKENRKARVEVAEIERHDELADLAAVLSTDAGRRVLLRIIGAGDVYSKDPSADSLIMARAEGRRQMAAWLIGEIQAVRPDAYPNLLLFHGEDAKRRQDFRAASSGRSRHD